MNNQLLPLLWTALAVLQNPLPLEVPGTVSPGDVMELYCWIPPESGAGWTAEYRNKSGELISSGRFFSLPESWEAPGFRLALLPFGPDTKPGSGEIFLLDQDQKVLSLGEVVVLPRNFKETAMRVTPAMRAVQTSPDPRRQEQSRRLSGVLEGFDPRALVSTGVFTIPVKVPYRPTSQYGDRRKELYPSGGSSLTIHHGTDMAAPTGTPIYSPSSGRALLVEDRILTGWTLVLEHAPGVYSLMYHLDSVSAVEGRLYRQGDPVGTLGSTGFSTGPHLHWEVRVNARAVDPLKFLERPLIDKARFFSILHRAFLQKRG